MRRQGGFTYVGVIVLVAIIGLVGAATLRVGILMQRAAAEEELLEIGATFSDALRSYAAATPKGQPTHPQSLGDLLKDPRFPGVRRHLRKLYIDPITGGAEWGLITAGEKGGILGFYSLSDSAPLKISNFDIRFPGFDNRKKISDWKFTATGQNVVATGSTAAPAPANPEPISPPPPRQPMPEPQEPPKPVEVPAEPVTPDPDGDKEPDEQKDPQEPQEPPAPAPDNRPNPDRPAPTPLNPVPPATPANPIKNPTRQ